MSAIQTFLSAQAKVQSEEKPKEGDNEDEDDNGQPGDHSEEQKVPTSPESDSAADQKPVAVKPSDEKTGS